MKIDIDAIDQYLKIDIIKQGLREVRPFAYGGDKIDDKELVFWRTADEMTAGLSVNDILKAFDFRSYSW